MSDISAIIDVFRMEEISKKKRASLIIRLGEAINNTLGGNYTDSLVWELVEILDPENPIFKDERYFWHYYGVSGDSFVTAMKLPLMCGKFKNYRGIDSFHWMF